MAGRQPGESRRVIVDVHTHIMWYPEHTSERWAQEALASKLVKLKYSGGLAHAASLDLHSYDAKPDDHWQAAQQADKVVVFGLQGACVGRLGAERADRVLPRRASRSDHRLGVG